MTEIDTMASSFGPPPFHTFMPRRIAGCLLAVTLAASASCQQPPVPTSESASIESHESALVSDAGQYGAMPHGTVSITIDDGPSDYTIDVATYLAAHHIPATFFFNGCRFDGPTVPAVSGATNCLDGRTFPKSVISDVIRLGHRVANHSQDHTDLTSVSTTVAVEQIRKTQTILNPYIHDGVYMFRPPFGYWNPAVATEVLKDASLNRLAGPILWGANFPEGCDGPTPYASPLYCAASLAGTLEANPVSAGVILLLHEANGSTQTLANIQALVHELETRNYLFSSLTDINTGGNFFVTSDKFQTPTLSASGFNDTAGFGSSSARFDTIRTGDLNSDGRLDVCGRLATGVVCSLSTDAGFANTASLWANWFSDSAGWSATEYASSIQLGDINGDSRADVCGRGSAYVWCATANAAGTGFQNWASWSTSPNFVDPTYFSAVPAHYQTFRLGDVNGDGKADACVRSTRGLECATSTGSAFTGYHVWSDAYGNPDFSSVLNAATIQLGDINGDKKADVCGRLSNGILCALSNGNGFGPASYWSVGHDFADAQGWAGGSTNSLSFKLGDINGDGLADVCGRLSDGIHCATSTGVSFTSQKLVLGAFTDSAGWNAASYGDSVQLCDVDRDGRTEVCGRGYAGMSCSSLKDSAVSN